MNIPNVVGDDEILHRRIYPLFVHTDGRVSSQAFRDPEMSVDRAQYTTVKDTLRCYEDYGLVGLRTSDVRQLGQEVVSDRQLLNPAHALVKGKKKAAVARRIARAASWIKKPEPLDMVQN